MLAAHFKRKTWSISHCCASDLELGLSALRYVLQLEMLVKLFDII
jgi:hypothetical protein